jgi:uncharacterized membrane protein YcaP (DUF421 family)
MGSIVRGLVVYLALLLVFRVAGKRALSEATTFDLVLLLIISESIQQAMLDSDNSLTNAMLLVLTLVGTDIALSLLQRRRPWIRKLLEGTPLVIVEEGRLHRDRMRRLRIDEEDLLSAAREHHGLAKLADIRYAVVEHSGKITVVPNRDASG